MLNESETQTRQVLKHLEDGYGITSIEALQRFGIFRLADVIFKLRNKGHDIKTTIIKQGRKRFDEYKKEWSDE